MARAQEQLAHLRQKQVQYLPSLSLTYDGSVGHSSSSVTHDPLDDFDSRTADSDTVLKLQWLVIDFGKRRADVETATQQLRASLADQAEAGRSVFSDAVHAYYDLQTAQTALAAKEAAEQTAAEVLAAAQEKYRQGTVAVTDELQARTSAAQARLERVGAEGDLEAARANLLTSWHSIERQGQRRGVAANRYPHR